MHRFKILMRRALHSDLEPIEVLPDEVDAIDVEQVHGGSEPLRRLLLWRRAALLIALLFQLPPLVVRFFKAAIGFGENNQDALAGLEFFLVLLEIGAILAIVVAMRRWASWKRSRRILFWGWAISFLGPFAIALIPLRSRYDAGGGDVGALVLGLTMGVVVLAQLAPKVLALIPGILRAAVMAKAAFPMSPMPGWVIQVAAPFDMLAMYIVVMLPYQLVGGSWIAPALLLLTIAPVFFYRGGKQLAAPHTLSEALAIIGRMRRWAIASNVIGGVFLVVGLLATVGAMEVEGKRLFTVVDVFLPVLSLIAGIFLLEVIGIDVMLAAMVRLHEGRTERADMNEAERAYDAELTTFAAAIHAAEARGAPAKR